jgi:hypothetical protein
MVPMQTFFSRNVDKTKKNAERLVLYSVIIEYVIFSERLSAVHLGEYSVFSASFNLLLYFFLSKLGNARIFLQKGHRNLFFSSSLLDVENKVFTTNR